MPKDYYHCYYCDHKWELTGFQYLTADPACPKCDSRGKFFIKVRKEADRGNEFGYEDDKRPDFRYEYED